MGKIIKLLTGIFITLGLWACGGGDTFRIAGEIPGIGTQNLNVIYYADGSYHATRTAVVGGKFMFEGASRDWTTVFIFTNARSLIGLVIVRNGENVNAKFELNKPSATVLSGTKSSELLSEWYSSGGMALESGNAEAINDAVKEFVLQHKDDLAATAVLTTYFRASDNPDQADSLLQQIDSKVRQGNLAEGWADRIANVLDSARMAFPEPITFFDSGDTVHTLVPDKNILILYSPDKVDRSIASDNLLKEFLQSKASDSIGVRFYEIDRYVSDTASWKTDVRDLRLPWMRLWHPLNSGKIPFGSGESIIVVDSTGTIVYNGLNITDGLKKAGF